MFARHQFVIAEQSVEPGLRQFAAGLTDRLDDLGLHICVAGDPGADTVAVG